MKTFLWCLLAFGCSSHVVSYSDADAAIVETPPPDAATEALVIPPSNDAQASGDAGLPVAFDATDGRSDADAGAETVVDAPSEATGFFCGGVECPPFEGYELCCAGTHLEFCGVRIGTYCAQ